MTIIWVILYNLLWSKIGKFPFNRLTSMLEKKFVGVNYEMLVTVLTILVGNIRDLSTSTNIPKMSPTSKFYEQHPKWITKIILTIWLIAISWLQHLYLILKKPLIYSWWYFSEDCTEERALRQITDWTCLLHTASSTPQGHASKLL